MLQEIPTNIFTSIFTTNNNYMDLNIGVIMRLVENRRKELKYTQEEVAQKIGVQAPQYRNLVHKRSHITLYQLNEICKFLDISAMSLIARSSAIAQSKEQVVSVVQEALQQLQNILQKLQENEN